MDKQKFWQIIEETKAECKGNIEGMADALEEKLKTYSLEEVQKFCGIFDTYHKAADQEGVISVGNHMNHDMLTDDGFIDFRNWLIAQGKEVYMEALKNPEILADESIESVSGWYEYETFGYVGMHVVEHMTGDFKKSFVSLEPEEKQDILSEIEYGEYTKSIMTAEEFESKFPKFTERFQRENEDFELRIHSDDGIQPLG